MRLKSISSFLASILLIGFTISTGIIVYYFASTLPRTQTQQISSQASKVLSCAGATFDVKVRNCNLLNGLVLWLRMDEGSGTIAYDYSGYGNNGTLYNGSTVCGGIDACPLWVDGKFGKALQFDGVDDYVDVPSSAILSGLNTITVEAWVNPTKTTEGTIVSKHDNYQNREWQLYINPYTYKYTFQVFDENTDTFSEVVGVAATIGKWTHIVGVYNNGKLQIYCDGVLTDSKTTDKIIRVTNAPIRIGNRADNTRYYGGIIDEVMIFNRSLSEEEIKFLYQEGLKKLQNSGMIQFSSQIKPYIAISNPSGKIYVENLRVGNQNSKEIKLIKPFYDLEFDSNFRFSKGNHQIKIENIGFNSTSKRPIIRISES